MVTFPITIRGQGEEQIPFLRTRIGDWKAKEQVPAWNPTGVAPMMYCSQTKDADGKYTGVCSTDPNDMPNPQVFLAHQSREALAR